MNYLNWDITFMLGLSAGARLADTEITFFHCCFLGMQPNGGMCMCTNKTFLYMDCSVRVSNELGASHPLVAKFSVLVVNANSVLISILFSAIVLIFKVGLSKLFTTDAEVIAAVSDLTPLLAISVFLNGIQPILSGNCAFTTGIILANLL